MLTASYVILARMDDRDGVRVRRQVRYLPYLVALLLLLQLAVPHKAWTILLVGVGGAWFVGYRWALSLARGLDLTRERRFGWAQVGDRLQERFILRNRGWAPALWVAVVDHSTLPGYQVSTVRPVGERALIHWFTDGVCRRRGVFTLGPTSLEAADPFGFYRVRLHYPGVSSMVVLPPVVDLPAIEVAPAQRAGEGQRIGAPTLDRSVSAAGVREYAPGDSLRRVHWPTSARRDDLFVRTFDSTPSGDWWIFLDLNERVQAGEGQDATLEHAIVLAASLAAQGLEEGTPVGLAAAGGDDEAIWIRPRLGGDQRWRILRRLALATPGDRPFAHLLAGASVKGRSSLVLITADVAGGWLEPLNSLVRRGAVPTVLLLDRAAFGGLGTAGETMTALVEMGVTHYTITPDLLDRPEMAPGQIGKWRRTVQGHWEPIFDPSALEWQELT